MNKFARTITAGSVIALALTAGLAAPALADSGDISATVTGGTLTEVAGGATLSGTTLDGQTVQHAKGNSTQWTLTDARGTGAAWGLNASATDFVSAAGTADTTKRTIAVTNLLITPGTITGSTGSDNAPTAAPLHMTNAAETLIAGSTDTKGTFTLTPAFDLSIPVNAYRSNYSGAVGSSTVNPYIATVTYTIG